MKLKADRIVVVLEQKIFIYNFENLKLIDHIETSNNPKGIFIFLANLFKFILGLCSMNVDSSTTVIACPGKGVGQLLIKKQSMRILGVRF